MPWIQLLTDADCITYAHLSARISQSKASKLISNLITFIVQLHRGEFTVLNINQAAAQI